MNQEAQALAEERDEVLRQLDDRTNQTWVWKRQRWAALVRRQADEIDRLAALSEPQINREKRWASLTKSTTDDFHRAHPAPVERVTLSERRVTALHTADQLRAYGEFDSLLNSFEQASQAPSPYRHGYAGHRRALIEYVRKLEAAQPTRSQKLADAGYTRRPSLWAMLARDALEMIATPRRPDGTWNHDRESCRLIAAEALGQYDDDAQPAHSDHQPKDDPTA